MRTLVYLAFLVGLSACTKSIEARKELDSKAYDALLVKIAPYVVKKPDEFSYEQRFDKASKGFYLNFIQLTQAELKYYHEKDTAQFFFFSHRDLTSLKEHYRGLGGYYRTNENDSIIFMNLLFHTPRFTKEEMEQKGKRLFESMINNGDVSRYINNRGFIETPNKDFYYNTKTNRWDYTENSSWKFLEKAKQEALQTDSIN